MPDRDRRAEARGALLHGRKGGRAVTALAPHIPVLLDEVVDALAIAPGERHVDATFGAGGYTRAMLAHGATVIAFDRDPDALAEGDRKSVVWGKGVSVRVDLGGRRLIKKKKEH